jgi:BASS family bile acid:Na+ symporter
VVQRLRIYTPLLATAAVVMIVGSMISTNVAVVSASGLAIITAVLTLHSCGFGLGYFISKGLGLSDKVCRTNAIEVSNRGLCTQWVRGMYTEGGDNECCCMTN